MEVKVMNVKRLDGDGPTKAFLDLSFDGAFAVKGFRLVEGKKGPFLGMPRQPGGDGKWYNIAWPLNNEFKAELEKAVAEAWNG